MTDAEFRDELRSLLKKHGADMEPDDLRSVADDLRATAENWEGVEV